MKSKIIVCYHKKFDIFENNVLIPIQVGRQQAGAILENIKGDNEGDNISSLNSSYCELTGLYWLWKNIEADNYGLFHYRRFMDLKNKYNGQIYPSKINLNDWDSGIIDKIMKKYDLVLPKKTKFNCSLYERYKKDHVIKDFDIILKIINRDYPQYSEAVQRAINKKEEYSCNMFIARKEIFDEYCTWLFDILKKAQQEIDFSSYDLYQKRVFGFLSERMLNIFVEYKILNNPKLKIKHSKAFMINPQPVRRINFILGEYIRYSDRFYVGILGIKYTRKFKKS